MIRRNFQHSFSLLNVDHVQLTAKWNYQHVISPYNRIYYIAAGEGELAHANGKTKLEAGYLYAIPNFTLCSMSCPKHMGQFFVQFFEDASNGASLFANNRTVHKVKAGELDVLLFKRLLEINPGRGINRSDNPKVYEKDIFYKEYQQLNNQQSTTVYLETQGILQQLTSRFLSTQSSRQNDGSKVPLKITETLNYILINLHLNLSVALLAARVNQNIDYFSRQFKFYTGTRPVTYITAKRIEKAQYLMATSGLNYSEIGNETGFGDLSYFSKAFKKHTGLSPREYRKQMYLVGFDHEG